MGWIKLIILIVLIFCILGSFAIAPAQSLHFTKEVTKATYTYIKTLAVETKNLIEVVLEKKNETN